MMNETEKAIRALEMLKERRVVPVSEEKMNEFLEMAIKALEQELCDNAISRQAAIDIIAETDITNGEEPVFTGRQVQALLKDLPSVNPQPKTGHWKSTIVRGSESYICSECSAECCYVTTNYCPSCGARMFEQRESEVIK